MIQGEGDRGKGGGKVVRIVRIVRPYGSFGRSVQSFGRSVRIVPVLPVRRSAFGVPARRTERPNVRNGTSERSERPERFRERSCCCGRPTSPHPPSAWARSS